MDRLIRPRLVSILAALLGVALAHAGQAAEAAASCQAVSAVTRVTLVELYTSEGCDSCPQADRWLSGLKGRPDVLAAAFHVDYWDRLGWKDRFADPRNTARQAESQRWSGARFSYTPQVLVNGKDWRYQQGLPTAAAPAVVRVQLVRESEARVQVRVQALDGSPQRLGAWWAVLEDDHVSVVRAGENAGATLRHDHVVREQGQLAPRLAADPAAWSIDVPAQGEGGRRVRLLLVVTDAGTGLPLQAVQLRC